MPLQQLVVMCAGFAARVCRLCLESYHLLAIGMPEAATPSSSVPTAAGGDSIVCEQQEQQDVDSSVRTGLRLVLLVAPDSDAYALSGWHVVLQRRLPLCRLVCRWKMVQLDAWEEVP